MFAIIVLLIINLMILKSVGANKKRYGPMPSGNDWTVYGTMGCGWTRKQLKHMENKGISHTFVDCDKGGCNGMQAFPTMVDKDGRKVVGYKEV